MSQHSPRDESRSGRRKARSAARASMGIDVGHEPPLNANGVNEADVDRREINLRWLGASVLTGLTGAALIGASIHIALQGAMTSAAPPERAVLNGTARTASKDDGSANTVRKSDKLVRAESSTAARQSFRAPMTIRSGDREAIKVRHFVRVATNLSLTTGT